MSKRVSTTKPTYLLARFPWLPPFASIIVVFIFVSFGFANRLITLVGNLATIWLDL